MTEEEWCRVELRRLRERYEQDSKKYIDRLVQIESLRPPRYAGAVRGYVELLKGVKRDDT